MLSVFLLVGFGLVLVEGGQTEGALGPLGGVVFQASAASQSALTAASGGISGFWDRHMELVRVKEENARLRDELHRVIDERTRLLGVMQENARLRGLVGFQEDHPTLSLLPARVVAKDVNAYFRVISVRLESTSALVREGMPVVSSAGLVGQVANVDGRFADVLLTVDRQSAVDVIVQRNRARGVLEGRGFDNDYSTRISYLLRRDEVDEGDVVVTSGMGGRFPRDVIVGRIAEVRRQNYGLFQEVVVEPAVDFSRLEEVFIVVGDETR